MLKHLKRVGVILLSLILVGVGFFLGPILALIISFIVTTVMLGVIAIFVYAALTAPDEGNSKKDTD